MQPPSLFGLIIFIYIYIGWPLPVSEVVWFNNIHEGWPASEVVLFNETFIFIWICKPPRLNDNNR